jgi:hypothetical protein
VVETVWGFDHQLPFFLGGGVILTNFYPNEGLERAIRGYPISVKTKGKGKVVPAILVN